MSLNLKTKTSHVIFDEWGMAVIKGDELSWRDSIGRTVLCWIAYGQPIEGIDKMISSLLFCYSHNCRHPQYPEWELSRDHLSYLLVFRRLFFGGYSNLPVYRRGMYLWSLALQNNKLAEFLYYTLAIPGAYIGNAWLRFCRKVGRIKPERDNNWWIAMNDGGPYPQFFPIAIRRTWGWRIQQNLWFWQKLWAWIIFQTIPAYALHVKAWQVYVMPNSKKKEKLKRILLKRAANSNLILRMLFGDTTVSETDVSQYPNMTGYRPGVYLDESCRRDIREMDAVESEFNTYEVELIKWLYESNTKNLKS
jgi:hypothetical protein